MRTQLIVVLLLALSALAACKSRPPPAASVPAPPASPASSAPAPASRSAEVTVVVGEGTPCVFSRLDPTSGARAALFTTPGECPDQVIFRAGGAVYRLKDRIYAHDFGAAPKVLAAGPWVSELQELVLAPNGTVHVVGLEPLDESAVKSVGTDDAPAYRVKIDGEEKVFRDWMPSWGVWYLAVHRALRPGEVKVVEKRPTKWEAGDTPGAGVIALPKNPAAYTAGNTGAGCVGPRCREPSDAQRRTFERVTGKEESDGIVLGSRALVYGVEWGDSPHPAKPFLFCDEGCASPVRLEGELSDYPMVSVAPPWVALGDPMKPRWALYEAGDPRPKWSLDGARFFAFVPLTL